jgi:hypothetical protein
MPEKDTAIASFIVKFMLNHAKINLDVIKEKFQINDLQIRECLIRLYFKGKIFGRIEENFIIFNEKNTSLALEDVIDSPLANFDLSKLIQESQSLSIELDGPALDENQLLQQHMQVQSSKDVDFSRAKESNKSEGISLETRFGFAGYKLKIKIIITNSSPTSITNGKVKLAYPPELHVISIFPNLDKEIIGDSIALNFGEVKENSSIILAILFRQEKYTSVNIQGTLQYTTSSGFARLLRIEPSTSVYMLPQFAAGTLSPEEIADFMKDQSNMKHILAFGVPKSISEAQAQYYMEQVVSFLGFINISKVIKKDMSMSFYSGQTETPDGTILQMLVVPQVKNNTMQIYAAGKNDEIIISLLRTLGYQVEQVLQADNVISTESFLIDLNCINCGAVLPNNCAQGEEIVCRFCRTSQTPWI